MKGRVLATHRYARSREVLAASAEDVLLVVALAVLAWVSPHERLTAALFVAIPLVVALGVATLHHPSRVHVDDDGIAFARYGRVHSFAWREIERIRVRRFLLGERVLVRISPASAFRGRYWILQSIERFADLMAAIESRAKD